MGNENELVSQDEIERLLQQSSQGDSSGATSGDADANEPASQDSLGANETAPVSSSGAEQVPEGASAASATTQPSQGAETMEVAGTDAGLPQEEIDKLLGRAGPSPPASTQTAAAPPSPDIITAEGEIRRRDVEYLLEQAQQALESIDSESGHERPSGVSLFQFQELAGAPPNNETSTLDLISDVELDLKIELGRTHMQLQDVLGLRRGSVVPLDKLAGDPVDIYVNERLIARGEVLVMNDNFCVRVAELIAGANPD